MNFIKSISLTVMMFISIINAGAQIAPQSKEDLVRYYQTNFKNLDPIEGAYNVKILLKQINPYGYTGSESDVTTMYIYRNTNGLFKVYNDSRFTIKKVGESNLYDFSVYWEGSGIIDTKSFSLDDEMQFFVKYSVPEKQLQHDMGKSYRRGIDVSFSYSFDKTYPTREMYLKIKQKSIEPEIKKEKQDQWSGTGFALKDGYILTNYHVVEKAKSIRIHGVNGKYENPFNAIIISYDKVNDLALLRIDDPLFNGFGLPPYALRSSVAEVGEEVFVLGYPLVQYMGNEIKLTSGLISSKSGYQGDISTYQISAPVQPGNSGGPLFDKKGNVVGVVNAGIVSADNVGYAIKVGYVKNLIETAVSSSIEPKNNSISSLSLTQQVLKIKNYIFIIECSGGTE